MIKNLANTYRKAYSGLPREVWLLAFALFINRCGSMVLAFLTLFLHEQLGMAEGDAAQMFAIYGLGSLVGTYLGGRLTNVVGAVRLVVILLLLSVPVFLVIPFIQTVAGVSVAIFVLAVFSEGVRPANNTAIAQYSSPEQQTRSFALQRMALNLGVSFGPAVGGFLAEIEFAWLFVADGLTTLACALMLAWAFGLHRRFQSRTSPSTKQSPEELARSPLKDTRFLAFALLVLITSLVFFQFHATYPLYLTDHYQLEKHDIGLLFSVNTVLIVFLEMILVDYGRRWNLLRAIGWGSALSCIGFGILPFGQSTAFCVFSMVVLTMGEMLSMPLASGWVAIRSMGRNRGMYMAWYAMTYSLALIIAPLIGGWCYEVDPDLIWYISLGAGVVVLACYYLLSAVVERRENERAEEPS